MLFKNYKIPYRISNTHRQMHNIFSVILPIKRLVTSYRYKTKYINFSADYLELLPTPMSARYKAWVCGRSLAGIHDHAQFDTPHSVGVLWKSDKHDAENST
jgi:hypothetical protein